jgi:ABC-type polysaccharide/polyol phosphate transport system ATPase subunit
LLALTRLSTTLDNLSAETSAPLAHPAHAVVVEHLEKTFRLPHRRYSTLKERALHPLRARRYDELRAVDDVTFSVANGEFFGIVGRNGSGKSTLLKCLAGIYNADAGGVSVNGRMSPFIELGIGFNPELTARDNVIVNAIMLGLTRKQAKARFDEIIAFAELEEFVDLPLKNYSSGMLVRLAFAVTVEVDAEILLIDEVLAVGDAAFQQKCYEQFEQLKREGRTIILVTHDMSAVERFCNRAMLIDRGRVRSIGGPHEIALAYNELNFGRLVDASSEEGRYGDRAAAEIKGAWFEDDAGERITELAQGAACTLCMDVRFHADVDEPIFAFHMRNEPRHTVFVSSSDWRPQRVGSFAAGETAHVRVRIGDYCLAPNRYTLSPSVARAGMGADVIDLREDLAAIVVHGTRVTGGLADLPHELTVERR